MSGGMIRRRQADHHKVADWCREWPGEWVLVNTYAALYVARSTCALIRGDRTQPSITAYQPAGDFESKYEMREEGWAVFAMYNPQ
jgi:hypothetical protein